jgi:hypothetical protein
MGSLNGECFSQTKTYGCEILMLGTKVKENLEDSLFSLTTKKHITGNKVKAAPTLIDHNAMRMNGAVEVKPHAF